MITGKVCFLSMFFLFSWQPLLGKQILTSQSCSLSIQNTVFMKNWSPADKGDSNKKMLYRFIFYPIAQDSDPNYGVKMEQKYRFWIFTTSCVVPEWIGFV